MRDRLLLENLDEGKPAIWHRNTLSLINENKFDNLKKSTPTQIVYPNSSFNIGLPVDSINLQESSNTNYDDPLYDEDGNDKPLIVYASNKPENAKNFRSYLLLVCLMIFYTIFVLYFGHLMKSHVDFTRSSVVYLKITKVSIFLYLTVLVLLSFGYSQVLRFNSLMTTVLMALGLFYIENIYGVLLSSVQLSVLVCNYHSIYKNTPKVFMVSSVQ
ncbi:putative integral membrane protein [Theileria parva strain Muguga]|uniref:Uncharacterized protein n=1 Tax=Theileria parva TaxID=5875 RepID=Q4N0X9_THEPA|nr:putative integral membrane protein [Theileria parva strain Muguga]EAN30902.1 putative integral membrane protein [Theileria parva strain Muguga]|eukprot:XP_763185.1 hypothetical protein [Theileria parva strain Muguga]